MAPTPVTAALAGRLAPRCAHIFGSAARPPAGGLAVITASEAKETLLMVRHLARGTYWPADGPSLSGDVYAAGGEQRLDDILTAGLDAVNHQWRWAAGRRLGLMGGVFSYPDVYALLLGTGAQVLHREVFAAAPAAGWPLAVVAVWLAGLLQAHGFQTLDEEYHVPRAIAGALELGTARELTRCAGFMSSRLTPPAAVPSW